MTIKAWTIPVALGGLLAGAASCSKLEKKPEQIPRKIPPATSINMSGPVSRPTLPTRKYTIRYVSVREPLDRVQLRQIRKRKPKRTCELMQKNPFLRLRKKNRLFSGREKMTGKGETSVFSVTLLKAGRKFFQLDMHGGQEFVHFDWDVTVANGWKLIRQVIRPDYWIPLNRFNELRKQIARRFPGCVKSWKNIVVEKPKLIKTPKGQFVRGMALAYIQHGRYYHAEEIAFANAIAKYDVTVGNGHAKTTVEILIQGPYNVDPVYWYGINAKGPPATQQEEDAALKEYALTKKFQRFVREFLSRR
jgi:hypothetical protein